MVFVELNTAEPEIILPLSCVKSVYWKFRGYLTDPRIFVSFKDGGVLMSYRLPFGTPPETLAQIMRIFIDEDNKDFEENPCLELPRYCNVFSSVDWKYGKSVHDKRLVFHLESRETYVTGPLPREMDVPAIAQSFFKKDWVGDGK
jgi:hypothetical protein